MWDVSVLTIFPDIFTNFLQTSIIGKALERGLLSFNTVNIRDFAAPPHFKVDDTPYGGGPGMVMMVEPLVKAIRATKESRPKNHVVLLSPGGPRFTQTKASELSQKDSVTFVCGRYEGVDQRVTELEVDEELSIGDFVVMGGEVPAMLVIEACIRLRPDVISNKASTEHESFSLQLGEGGLVEAPQYTRPDSFEDKSVPEVLLSGDHARINQWRLQKAKTKTAQLKDKGASK
jgi:tRNA (guanine37-N1)-methyltransferase